MDSTGSRQADHLIDQLVSDASRFDFNQAVRLIYRIAALTESERVDGPGQLASDANPDAEPVRFHCHPASRFPAASLHAVKPRENAALVENGPQAPTSTNGSPSQFDLTVLFAGLTGPNGVLPRHFTTLLVEQRRENNLALEQFQDLFNHRLISLFYRAWEKHQFPIAIEQATLQGDPRGDTFTRCLFSLIGMGLDRHRDRLSIDDRSVLFFAGHYARKIPTATGIRDTLAEYFKIPVQIEQFIGEWLKLDTADRSRFGNIGQPEGQNMALGVNTVVGERIWYNQSRFRLRLGPLTFNQYRRFLPDMPAMQALCELVRLHVGAEYDFDTVPVLKRSEVPGCHLGGDDAPRLGWTTFLCTTTPERDFAEAHFERPDL